MNIKMKLFEREGEIVTLALPIYEEDNLTSFLCVDSAFITRGTVENIDFISQP